MSKAIIYPSTKVDDEGNTLNIVAVMIPAPKYLETLSGTEDEKYIYVANKDLPVGTKYEITEADLSDRSFREAWEYTAGAGERTSEENP
jgi:hypothetical protein|tara:strand:- start:479 stop:745 length:267 start_codon:yes stop_codon:yes gene_type:complete